METPQILPNVDRRVRAGTITIGYDRVEQIRAEHGALFAVAALVMAQDNPTIPDISNFLAEIHGRVERLRTSVQVDMDEERRETVLEDILVCTDEADRQGAYELLAWAIVLAERAAKRQQ